jgi:hypothetical protein
MSPDFPRGTGKSIGGDLDVDDEGSEQRRLEPMLTRIGLAKKAIPRQANREHKQKQERTILNCR